jgi:hypothetical protein
LEGLGAEIDYGASLADADVLSGGNMNMFLVHATLAGHAPYGCDGICATLLGFHAWNCREALALEEWGVLGDALGAMDPNMYRIIGALVERLTAEAEERTAELHLSSHNRPVDAATRRLREKLARSARRRADRARRRQRDIERDGEELHEP